MPLRSICPAFALLFLAACGDPKPASNAASILEVNDDEVTETIEDSSGLLLVHFSSYDENCGYCIDSNAHIEEVARDSASGLTVARITWEPWSSFETASPDLTKEYWIRGLPTMILYKDGKELWRGSGHTQKNADKLAELLER